MGIHYSMSGLPSVLCRCIYMSVYAHNIDLPTQIGQSQSFGPLIRLAQVSGLQWFSYSTCPKLQVPSTFG